MDWKRGDATKDNAKPLQQRFDDKKTLARTRYEALGATEGFGNDGKEGRKFRREKLYKMHTLHGVLKGHTIPLVYMLFETENERTICHSSDWTKRNQLVFADFSDNNWFENRLLVGYWRDFSESFDESEIFFIHLVKHLNVSKNRIRDEFAGCFFHFAQANWCDLQDFGLKKAYVRYLFTTVDLICLWWNLFAKQCNRYQRNITSKLFEVLYVCKQGFRTILGSFDSTCQSLLKWNFFSTVLWTL